MGQRAAMRMLTGSPRSTAWASEAVIMPVSEPRRRCVGRTITLVSASAATCVPPRTDISFLKLPNAPTGRAPSNAAQQRSRSTCGSFHRAVVSGGWVLKKATLVVVCQASNSSSLTVRISNPMARTYRSDGCRRAAISGGYGQPDLEPAAHVLVRHVDPAVVRVDDATHDRQTQTGAG